MEELIAILEEVREDIDYENTTDLIDGGILDSFDILQIIKFLRITQNSGIAVITDVLDNFSDGIFNLEIFRKFKGCQIFQVLQKIWLLRI